MAIVEESIVWMRGVPPPPKCLWESYCQNNTQSDFGYLAVETGTYPEKRFGMYLGYM